MAAIKKSHTNASPWVSVPTLSLPAQPNLIAATYFAPFDRREHLLLADKIARTRSKHAAAPATSQRRPNSNACVRVWKAPHARSLMCYLVSLVSRSLPFSPASSTETPGLPRARRCEGNISRAGPSLHHPMATYSMLPCFCSSASGRSGSGTSSSGRSNRSRSSLQCHYHSNLHHAHDYHRVIRSHVCELAVPEMGDNPRRIRHRRQRRRPQSLPTPPLACRSPQTSRPERWRCLRGEWSLAGDAGSALPASFPSTPAANSITANFDFSVRMSDSL